jgi:hypothetical protein
MYFIRTHKLPFQIAKSSAHVILIFGVRYTSELYRHGSQQTLSISHQGFSFLKDSFLKDISLFSYPITHFRFTNKLVKVKKRVKHPCSPKIVVFSFEKIEIFLEYAFYFLMI